MANGFQGSQPITVVTPSRVTVAGAHSKDSLYHMEQETLTLSLPRCLAQTPCHDALPSTGPRPALHTLELGNVEAE